jgi:hypothetical protein
MPANWAKLSHRVKKVSHQLMAAKDGASVKG